MRITHIETVRSKREIALPRPWRPAWEGPEAAPVTATGFAFYRVHTDEGITGIGPSPGGVPHRAESALIGQDPTHIERFFDLTMAGRASGISASACGGLEIALWDIVGKAAGLPVYRLLGACRDRVPAYAATSELRPPDEMARLALELQGHGFRAIKLRLHRPDPEDDLDVVRAVRDAVGDRLHILVDANQNNAASGYAFWSRRTALRVARELERLDVYWLEEPLPRRDLAGLAELRAATEVYIAGGEHCANVYEFRDALFAGAYDVVQPDVILGTIGITGIRKVAVLADALGKLVAPHVCGGGNNGFYLAATLQALGTVTNGPFVEYTLEPPVLTPDVLQLPLKEPIVIDEDGMVPIPQRPGIGIELNEEVIEEYTS